MAHRSFTDARGRFWEVWEVRPGVALIGAATDQRRREGDRRRAEGASAWIASGQPERRSRRERRVGVATPLRNGWLAFRCGDERRRLAPVPHDWEHDADARLAAYCEAAQVVGDASGVEGGRRERSG